MGHICAFVEYKVAAASVNVGFTAGVEETWFVRVLESCAAVVEQSGAAGVEES